MDSPAGAGRLPEPVAFFRQREAELIGFAQHDFRLHALSSDGTATNRAHLEVAARKGNAAAIAKLKGPEISDDLRALWDVYLSFQRWRGMNGMSVSPMTLPDLREFETRYGYAFTPWESDALKSIDLAQIATVNASSTRGG